MARIVLIGEAMLELSRKVGGGWNMGYGGNTLNTAVHLARAGQRLGIADFALGGWLHRLIRCPEELELGIPTNIRNYYTRHCIRKPFEYHISTQVSAGLQRIGG